MEAGSLAPRRVLAAVAVPGSTGPRVGLLFAGTGLALFAVMGLLGIAMRASQGEIVTISAGWFYWILTLHGAGMLVGALLAQMGGMWYAVRGTVPLSVARALVAYLAMVAGAVLVLVATLVGGFAPGWTFLWPLPFESRGAWETWSTATFFVGLVLVGAGFVVYCVDLLSQATPRFGGLARALGIAHLRGAGRRAATTSGHRLRRDRPRRADLERGRGHDPGRPARPPGGHGHRHRRALGEEPHVLLRPHLREPDHLSRRRRGLRAPAPLRRPPVEGRRSRSSSPGSRP